MEKALSLYEESLEIEERIGRCAIKERIGDVQGKAATLAMMGQLLVDCDGDFKIALAYLQESFQILQRLKSPDAGTVKAMLNNVHKRFQAQLTKA